VSPALEGTICCGTSMVVGFLGIPACILKIISRLFWGILIKVFIDKIEGRIIYEQKWAVYIRLVYLSVASSSIALLGIRELDQSSCQLDGRMVLWS